MTALAELIEAVDPDAAVQYAERLGRNSVKKRMGYLFEHVRGLDLEELRVTDRNYPALDLTGPAEGEKDTRWRVTVNADVV